MTDTDNTVATPKTLALELKGFAEGVQLLVDQLEGGYAHEPTKEQLASAENAALSLLRNAPLAIRTIRRLEGYADEIARSATERRDGIMTSMFGPDTT